MNYIKKQFRHCQATIVEFERPEGDYTIFYSYTCPKIVKFPNGEIYRFSYEGSRKAGAITESKTTSKQCNKRLGYNHKKLKEYNLKWFEDQNFDTRIDFYY